MDLGLQGKTALVTGASRGIGKATAIGLAREGANVAICARSGEVLQQVVSEIETDGKGRALAVEADMTRLEDIKRFVDAAARRFGRIDILVNNASGYRPADFMDLGDEEWLHILTLKVLGYVRCAREVIPHMQRQGGGRIINVAGVAGRQPGGGIGMHGGVANAAVMNFTKALATLYAKDNILVTVVNPGAVWTEHLQNIIRTRARQAGTAEEEAIAASRTNNPLGRIADPEELANVVVFLASEKARYVTGTSVTVDGGSTRGVF